MHTASSAISTWSDSRSASEYTATVAHAELTAGSDDPHRDLAAIGDEDFPEGRRHDPE